MAERDDLVVQATRQLLLALPVCAAGDALAAATAEWAIAVSARSALPRTEALQILSAATSRALAAFDARTASPGPASSAAQDPGAAPDRA